MTVRDSKRSTGSDSESTAEASPSGVGVVSRGEQTDVTGVNRRAVLQALGVGTVGLPAVTQVTSAQEEYEPEIVMRNSFENGMVMAGPDRDLPSAAEIDYWPEEDGPKGELGAEIAEAARGPAQTEVSVRKREMYRAEEATTVESVVVADRTPPKAAEAPGEQQLERLGRQGAFQDLGEQITGALDDQVEEVTNETVFFTDRVPGRGFDRFPEQVRREVNEVVSERLETRFESMGGGFVAEPVSATTRPVDEEREIHPPAYGGSIDGRRVDNRQDWCVWVCEYFCPWWLQSLCQSYCDDICDGVCWVIDWFASFFNLEDWEEELLRQYAGC